MTDPKAGDLNAQRNRFLRYRAALRDPTTGLFTFSLYFDRIREMLTERRQIGVLWAGLGDRRMVESVYGWEAYDQHVAQAARYLKEEGGAVLPESSLVTTSGVHSDAFVLFVPANRDGSDLSALLLADLARVLRDGIEQHLDSKRLLSGPLGGKTRVGAALLVDNPFHRFERCVYQSVEEARELAERPRESERLAWMGELQRLVRERDVRSIVQPIVNLETEATVGFEVFSRGPERSPLRLPRVMFALGRQAGLVRELDRVCRDQAIASLASVSCETGSPLLFLNTAAENLLDPAWTAGDVVGALSRAGFDPQRVVLDASERQFAGETQPYCEALDDLRSHGYRLSLDDVGSGAQSVMLIQTLRPEFIKFDMTLVRRLPESQLSRELIRSLVRLAERAGARFIAECVETEEEAAALRACGATWGQGRHLGAEHSIARVHSTARNERSESP